MTKYAIHTYTAPGPVATPPMRVTCSKGQHKDLAVPDVAFGTGAGHAHDRVDRAVQEVIVDRDFQRDLPQQMRLVFHAAIVFRVTALTPKSLRVTHRHAFHTDLDQRLAQALSFVGWMMAMIIFTWLVSRTRVSGQAALPHRSPRPDTRIQWEDRRGGVAPYCDTG